MYGLLITYFFTAYGALKGFSRPQFALFVYIGFAVVRPRFLFGWAGDLSGISDIVAGSMLIGWAINGFGNWNLGRGRAALMALLFFGLWAVPSALQARYSGPAFAFFPIFAKVLLPFLVGITTLETKKEIRTLLWIILIGQGYVAYELNMSYFRGYNVLEDAGYGGMDSRSYGIALVTVLGLGVGLTLFAQNWKERIAAGTCVLFILHATLLSFSRGAFLGLIVLGMVSFLVLPKRPKYLAAMFVLSLITLRMTGPELTARFMSTFAEEDSRDGSASSRIRLWQDCLRVIEEDPLFGIGPDNWPHIAHEYGWTPGKEAHSVWMQTGAEFGVPGLAALLLFYIFCIARLWPIARSKRPDADRADVAAAVGIIMGLGGFFVSAQFVSLKGLEPPYYLAMAAIALLRHFSTAPVTVRETTPMSAYLHPALRKIKVGPGA